MSTIQVANVVYKSDGTTRIQSPTGDSISIYAGSANVAHASVDSLTVNKPLNVTGMNVVSLNVASINVANQGPTWRVIERLTVAGANTAEITNTIPLEGQKDIRIIIHDVTCNNQQGGGVATLRLDYANNSQIWQVPYTLKINGWLSNSGPPTNTVLTSFVTSNGISYHNSAMSYRKAAAGPPGQNTISYAADIVLKNFGQNAYSTLRGTGIQFTQTEYTFYILDSITAYLGGAALPSDMQARSYIRLRMDGGAGSNIAGFYYANVSILASTY
jgi:hypothetical protein